MNQLRRTRTSEAPAVIHLDDDGASMRRNDRARCDETIAQGQAGTRVGFSIGMPTMLPHSVHEPS